MKAEQKAAIEASIEEAKQKNLFESILIRPGVKVLPGPPEITISIPMGDKDDPSMLTCDHCEGRHFTPVVKCPYCEKEHPADRKLRRAGLAPVEWLLNAWQLVPPLLCSVQVFVRKSVLSAQARNEMTYEAIKSGTKYIFYWDDDTLIPQKTIYEMHGLMERVPEAAIITGVYCTREPCSEPLLYKANGEGAYWGVSKEPGVLEEVFAAGAGCMMARVEALEDVERILGGKWWEDVRDLESDDHAERNTLWGHDVRFCKRVWDITDHPEARQHWKVLAAGWIQCGHFDVDEQTVYMVPDKPKIIPLSERGGDEKAAIEAALEAATEVL